MKRSLLIGLSLSATLFTACSSIQGDTALGTNTALGGNSTGTLPASLGTMP